MTPFTGVLGLLLVVAIGFGALLFYVNRALVGFTENLIKENKLLASTNYEQGAALVDLTEKLYGRSNEVTREIPVVTKEKVQF